MRVLTLVAWGLGAWSATYWSLKFVGTRAAPVPVPAISAAPAGEPALIARVFGPVIDKPVENPVVPQAPDPSKRFALVGVVYHRANAGVALLSVEGKPARPYRVGSIIDEGYTLKSVTGHSATLATRQSSVSFTIHLPGTAAPLASPPAPAASAAPGSVTLPANAANPLAPLQMNPRPALPPAPRSS